MNAVQRPRILFESVPDDLLESLSRYGPVTGSYGVDVEEIHESDWDLVVSFKPDPVMPAGVNLLSFGGDEFYRAISGSGHPVRRTALHARTVQRDQACPDVFASLVDRTILEAAPPPPRSVLFAFPSPNVEVLVSIGAEDATYAGVMRIGSTFALALPGHTTDHAGWLSAFIKYLRESDPVGFPADPDWQRSRAWATPEARVAIQELDDVNAERTAVLERLAARETAATVMLDQATASATTGPGSILTADGDDLVAGVLQVLTDLGFTAEDRDGHHDAATGAKLEDLLVTEDSWTCLVEVKGYSKGAKVNDVPQITGRPSVAYAIEHGRAADAVWHIVNAWRRSDPETRAPAIPNDVDLAPLTDASGCLIDTRDLFRAWRDVVEGRATAEDVRTSLRGAVTRWTWSSPE